MDNASYFITDKALFGSFPKQKDVEELENNDIRFFVDLTYSDEKKIQKYTTKYTYINYPIKDRKAPFNVASYVIFIKKIIEIINNLDGEKLYIHCRAGHSRSSLVVACLLCILKSIKVNKSITLTREFHNKRKNLKNKWLKIPHLSPSQLRFIHKIFNDVIFFRAYKETNIAYGFSNYSNHEVYIENVGKFMNAQVAYNAMKLPTDTDYTTKHLRTRTTYESNKLAKTVILSDKEGEEILRNIVRIKIEQHEDVKEKLLKTGFAKLIYNNKNDFKLGIGDGTGKNILGKILMDVREKYTEKLI